MSLELSRPVKSFLNKFLGPGYQYTPIAEGANALGYKIEKNRHEFFLKVYKEGRDIERYRREVFFYKTFGEAFIEEISTFYASSDHAICLLLGFFKGMPIRTTSKEYVADAVKFFEKLEIKNVGGKIPLASEPAFTLSDFYDIVQRRIETKNLFHNDVLNCVNRVSNALSEISISGYSLPIVNIYSPSDFGAHNVLYNGDKYHFIDFEHAGIDSYWKFLCDFFAQPDYPVDISMLHIFRNSSTWHEYELDKDAIILAYRMTLLKGVLLILATGIKLNRDPGS